MTKKKNGSKNGDQVKDGFDLIEYPCDFVFKAMCYTSEKIEQNVCRIIRNSLNETAVLGYESRPSRTGKYCSVSVTARLQTREELEAVYQALSAAPEVVMTL